MDSDILQKMHNLNFIKRKHQMTQMRDILQSRSVILKNVSCHKRKTEKSVLIKGDKRYDNQILCKITDWILGLWEKKNIIRTTEKI